jgi:cellulose synthase/poly-beta-1,6-N-acetylglucosamine synthase-like glycosyltransferase
MTYYHALVHYLQGVAWVHWMVSLQWVFLAYFVIINLFYLALNYISVFSIVRYMRDHRAVYLPEGLREYQPPVSIILPAFNEFGSMVSTVRSLLNIDYPEFEIVVVNDGSGDETLQQLVDASQ